MKIKDKFLAIDAGSVTIGIALLNSKKEVIQTAYEFHEGKIAGKLLKMLSAFNLSEICAMAATSSTPRFVNTTAVFDNRVSVINAVKYFYKETGSILIVGGEKFGLIQFDEKLNYKKFKSNTSCAAGTGSFLDQQCSRLNIKSISEFSEFAFNNRGNFPKIASRCSVFAKTDLIHAQQEGYSLSEICDGLCYGLAKNIADTLFSDGNISQPMIFAGGVSLNKAVAKHLENLTGIIPVVGQNSHLYGAIGAAISLIDSKIDDHFPNFESPDDIVKKDLNEKSYFYNPLQLELSNYPDFSTNESYVFNSDSIKDAAQVEVDIYARITKGENNVYLGFDIGSTSTKAIIIDENKIVLAGFYTRTSGQPVIATQIILEAINNFLQKKNIRLNVLGVGTTGSGRKFIGKIIGADIIPDEITAHARAAVELDQDVDTIIEIGGQDSKFTTLRNGSVTFSVMNNVCAAGTGSFIEEQARKLGISLNELSEKAANVQAPMASDRCTVFMERDLNHYINFNYQTNEILASVLHSVRDNYLAKVAVEKNIGNKIFFQGATAKNKSLIAAFEQKLNKPIMVSKYCHLTGAYGVALELVDKGARETRFRGIQLYKKEIPVRTEICELCTNHCKYKIAEVESEREVYGFLCGRDILENHYVNNDTSGFNLVKEYSRHFNYKSVNRKNSLVTIGLPAGLYLFEDMYMWQHFFDLLNMKTITSKDYGDAVKTGKGLSGAEFCAPMAAIHGHVKYLSDKADFVFLPTYLESKQKSNKIRRQYCYYSQYAPPVVSAVEEISEQRKIINPLLYSLQSDNLFINQLYQSLRKAGLNGFELNDVKKAYQKAQREKNQKEKEWKKSFKNLRADREELKVMLLGRPYTVLSNSMNNNIPEIFAQKGVKTFFQNMIDIDENEIESIREILGSTKWKYAAQILATADFIARSTDLYPVYITSFKCSPDSFIIEYFKQLMDFYSKPYLILQLDEHSSNVGYETRIEAALRSFQNHFGKKEKAIGKKLNLIQNNLVTSASFLKGKTLLLPSLGEHATKLIEANLRRIGIDAHTLFDTEDSIKKSLIKNTGQCLPLNVILQNAFEYIEKHRIDPSNTVLWMIESPVSCNLGMFISFMSKTILDQKPEFHGIKVYTGDISFADISVNTTINSYLAFLIGGYIRKVECKLRPYEKMKGHTDKVIKRSMDFLYQTFLDGSSKEEALKKVIGWIKEIEVYDYVRPKVAIFGDIYARDNDVFNQNLVRFIEENGGEAITTPYSEYVKIMFFASNKRLFDEGYFLKAGTRRFLVGLVTMLENKYLRYFNEVLHEPIIKPLRNFKDKLEIFNLNSAYNGESLDNVLKIMHLKEYYPDIALFVQTNPSYCCPSLVTEAMNSKMEKVTGTPIVTIEYDGTNSNKNECIIPFLQYLRSN